MNQICCVSACLLKLSLLYPAPHMDTTMLRISPSFFTKPSEQPAKNNITCCPPPWTPPPWRRHYWEEELIGFKTSPSLASVAATNSKHRPDFFAASSNSTRGQRLRGVEGESLYFWISSLYIFQPKAGQRAYQVIF